MRTLTVNRDQIVQALLDTQHASKPPTSYVVAFNPFDCSPITARVIYADTPSLAGGFTTNFQDEINANLLDFLDDDEGKNSFTWGEAGEGTGPNGETTDADEEAAREWIDANLADRVAANGETFAVVYLPDARSDAREPTPETDIILTQTPTTEQLQNAVESQLYLQTTGHLSAIEVVPGGQKDGLDYGPIVVEIVVLDSDGDTIAFRLSSDAQDDDWSIGKIEDAVECAIEYRRVLVG